MDASTQNGAFFLSDIAELVTMFIPGQSGPILPSQMGQVQILQTAYLEIAAGQIVGMGPMAELKNTQNLPTVSVQGRTVLPGLVDPHTHLVFAGTREHELVQRIRTARNQPKDQRMAGGINFTVSKTREASFADLQQAALGRLARMLAHGTTTAEAKSGYGLNLDHELRLLEVVASLGGQPIELVSTFLGAHAVPAGHSQADYVEEVLAMIPIVAERKLAEFCDVFCEQGFFTPEETRRILLKAREHGLKLKLHADELAASGGSILAGELAAVSADHLQFAPPEGLQKMKAAGTIPVLLPGTAFYLGLPYADTVAMRELDLPLAISTDLNPGGCYCESQLFMCVLACTQMGMLPIEALVGVTVNAAWAIDRGQSAGVIAPGRQADLVVLDTPNHMGVPYHFGVNLVHSVYKRGKKVWEPKI
ncbi:MAG: imidazolonepropionase [Candidatus Sericytochromatia bacterium]|nr:imidazolonepropionase [Candidatus Sericytochromatia bacterium]